eukprot:4228164-Pyramimonas_sp.AAC.1
MVGFCMRICARPGGDPTTSWNGPDIHSHSQGQFGSRACTEQGQEPLFENDPPYIRLVKRCWAASAKREGH